MTRMISLDVMNNVQSLLLAVLISRNVGNFFVCELNNTYYMPNVTVSSTANLFNQTMACSSEKGNLNASLCAHDVYLLVCIYTT